jgi:hypothetical protein
MNNLSELKNHLDSDDRLKLWPSKRSLQRVALVYTEHEVILKDVKYAWITS